MDEEEKKKMEEDEEKEKCPPPPQIGDPGSATGCRTVVRPDLLLVCLCANLQNL
jgi:hypothetical protein